MNPEFPNHDIERETGYFNVVLSIGASKESIQQSIKKNYNLRFVVSQDKKVYIGGTPFTHESLIKNNGLRGKTLGGVLVKGKSENFLMEDSVGDFNEFFGMSLHEWQIENVKEKIHSQIELFLQTLK